MKSRQVWFGWKQGSRAYVYMRIWTDLFYCLHIVKPQEFFRNQIQSLWWSAISPSIMTVLDNLLWVTSRWTDWSLSSASCQLSVLLFLNERHNKMPTIIRGEESVLAKCPWETLWYKVRNDNLCFIAIYEESISAGDQICLTKSSSLTSALSKCPQPKVKNWELIDFISYY